MSDFKGFKGRDPEIKFFFEYFMFKRLLTNIEQNPANGSKGESKSTGSGPSSRRGSLLAVPDVSGRRPSLIISDGVCFI